MRVGLDFQEQVRQLRIMKLYVLCFCAGGLLWLTGCASRPRAGSAAVPPQWNAPSAPAEQPEEDGLDIPDLAEGLRLIHEDEEITMEILVRGGLPEGSLVQVAVRPDTRHTAVSETLVQLHAMGFLVGIYSEKTEEPGE